MHEGAGPGLAHRRVCLPAPFSLRPHRYSAVGGDGIDLTVMADFLEQMCKPFRLSSRAYLFSRGLVSSTGHIFFAERNNQRRFWG